MKKRIFEATLLAIMLACICQTSYYTAPIEMVVEEPTNVSSIKMIEENNITIKKAEVSPVGNYEEPEKEIEESQEEDVISIPLVFSDAYYDPQTETYREEEFWDDMELIALVCVAEAEGESEYGKRLVIDTIFNRVDSEYFPNTIREVVYAAGQYECVSNGRVDRVEYNEYIANLVMEEMDNRTNSDVIYFRTDHYFNFGHPLFQEGSHYFSGR